MRRVSKNGAPRWAVWAGRAVAIMAAGGLLAGCMGTSTDATGSNGGDSMSGVSGGNGYAFSSGGGHAFSSGGGYASSSSGADGGNGSDGQDGGSYSYSYSGPSGYSYSYSSSGPDGVAGSGRPTTRTIDLSRVTSVVAGANFVVHLRTGGPAQATVTMDDNLTDRIEATVTGNELHLGIKPGMSVRNATLSAEVTVGQLEQLAANGASKVTLSSPVTGSALRLDANGAGQITGPVRVDHLEASESGASVLALSGRAGSLHLSSAGTSRLLGVDLAVANLDAVLTGACQATVSVSDTLAATADGVSVLHYRGSPRITRQETSGVSSIVPDSP